MGKVSTHTDSVKRFRRFKDDNPHGERDERHTASLKEHQSWKNIAKPTLEENAILEWKRRNKANKQANIANPTRKENAILEWKHSKKAKSEYDGNRWATVET